MARLYKRSRKNQEESEPDKLSFLLNNELIEVDQVDPTQTVLNFLRKDRGLYGTKDGCAEGGCGACTVTVGEMQGSKVKYESINSCISFVSSLHGKHLITVEGIKQNGKLHPVQQNLVSAHASQCGFCMPGFVMSLYTLCYEQDPKFSRQKINNILAGNLCRCTGYKSIVTVAQKLLKRKNLSRFGFNQLNTISKLKKTSYKKSQSFILNKVTYHAPVTSDELAELLQQYPGATLIAGGTDVALWVTKQHQKLDRVISLERIDALKVIRKGKDTIALGAGATLSAVQDLLGKEYPDLGELIRRFGCHQIRNRATVIGNIANGSPIGDMSPALIVLDAKLTLRAGTYRRFLKLEDFFIDYDKQDIKQGEFIERLQIPRKFKSSIFNVYKLSKRFDQDTSIVCGAFKLQLDDQGYVRNIRICFGGLDVIPKRPGKVEQALLEEKWNFQTVNKILPLLEQDYKPITDCQGSREYRLAAARNLVKRFYLETQSDTVQTRLTGVLDG